MFKENAWNGVSFVNVLNSLIELPFNIVFNFEIIMNLD